MPTTNLESILAWFKPNLTLAARVRVSASIQCLSHSPLSKAQNKGSQTAAINTRRLNF